MRASPLRSGVTPVGGPCQTVLPANGIWLIWTRLRRIAVRIAAAAAGGKLRVRAAAGGVAAARLRPAASAWPDGLPRGRNWLVRLAPETAVYGSQLAHMLADPEMTALLDATPRLRRALRPLCHMLGVEMAEAVAPPDPPPSAR